MSLTVDNQLEKSATITDGPDKEISSDSTDTEHESVDEDGEPWFTVGPRRRALSLDSGKLANRKNKFSLKPAKFPKTKCPAKKPELLTIAQGAVIKEAEKKLSQAQRKLLQKWMEKVNKAPAGISDDSSESSESSRGEGPSQDKGKGPDPKNWGAAEFNDSDVDIQQQREALDNFRAIHNVQQEQYDYPDSEQEMPHKGNFVPKQAETPQKKSKVKKNKTSAKNHAGSEALTDLVETYIRDIVEQRPRKAKSFRKLPEKSLEHAMHPNELIAPTNHLAKLLTLAKSKKPAVKSRNKGRGNPRGPSYPSFSSSSLDSSSSSSGSDSEPTDSDSDSSSSFEHSRHKHCHSHKRKKKMLLKPDPLEPYNGTADVQTFIKFVTEATAYVHDGQVPRKHRVMKISEYLNGKAYQFYLSTVADSPFDWRLKQFFTELYNYCFPLTYQLDQRWKLK